MARTYRDVFPVGYFTDTGATSAVRNVGGTGTVTLNYNQNGGARMMLNHPDIGLKPNGMNAVMWNNYSPWFHSLNQDLVGTVESEVAGGPIFQGITAVGSTTSDAGKGWLAEWFQVDPYDPGYHTEARADAIAATYAPIFAAHPSVLAYSLFDDADADDPRTWIATLAMQRATGLPAACVWTNNGFPEQMGADFKLGLTYRYPCGEYADGTDTAEGDFHAATMAAFGGDWVDAIRAFMDARPAEAANAPVWWIPQTHKTTFGPAGTQLRYPTAREMRKQFWTLIGEGAKGLFWFTPTDLAGVWDGLVHPNHAHLMTVAAELAKRFSPKMRRAMLDSEKVADLFTTSGGGASYPPPATLSYASAYVSTKYDAARDEYYVILCNHSTSPATVTVSSATLTGYLESMETGARFRIGQSVDLPALDGGIWKYDPYIGVPQWDVDYSVPVKTYWSTHWMNPVSPNYWGDDDIKTWPREVVVAAGNLEAAIAGSPDMTTFRLSGSGVHDLINLVVGRSHMHFIPDDPLDPPTVRGFEKIIGSEYFRWYNGSSDPTFGAVEYHLFDRVGAFGNPHGTPGAKIAHRNPKTDWLFKDLIFDGDGAIVNEHYVAMFSQSNPTGFWAVDHHAEKTPIFLRNMAWVLVQGNTFRNYIWGDDPYPENAGLPTYPDPVIESSAAGIPGKWHPGMLSGNSGLTGIYSRHNTFEGSSTSRGSICGIFFDGARGCVSHEDAFPGRWHNQQILLLTNDDYTGDVDRDGWFQQDHDTRNANYNIISKPTLSPLGGIPIAITGRDNLIDQPMMSGMNHVMPKFVHLVARCARVWFLGVVYRHHGNVVQNAQISGTGTIQKFVETEPDGGTACTGTVPTPNPWAGVIGRTAVEDNDVGGITVTAWLADKDGSVVTSDGPNVVLNNTDATGTRDGP